MNLKHVSRFVAAGLSAVCLTGIVAAQEESQSVGETVEMTVIGTDDQGSAPMIFSTFESSENGESTGMRIMSGGAGMTMAFGGGDFVMPAPDPWSMISNPSVQKDLELVGDQLKQVQDLQSQFAKEMKNQIGDLSKGGINKDRFKDLPALMEKLKAEQREKLEGLLLPHQIERLQQVALQTHMKQSGTAGALASDQVAQALGLTKEQVERMKKRSKEINEQLAKDTAELKEKAKKELLAELTTDQRKKLEEMTGDKYTPQKKDWEESFKNRRRPSVRRTNRGN
ncbi:MAG: hypothetical protein ACI87E_000453 [Mariniblastus sp.]|jgi:hypothetical protein